jgi:hypothetical protein
MPGNTHLFARQTDARRDTFAADATAPHSPGVFSGLTDKPALYAASRHLRRRRTWTYLRHTRPANATCLDQHAQDYTRPNIATELLVHGQLCRLPTDQTNS